MYFRNEFYVQNPPPRKNEISVKPVKSVKSDAFALVLPVSHGQSAAQEYCNAMKKSGTWFQDLRMSCLILAAACLVFSSGCATTGEQPASPPKTLYGIEKKHPSPTANMNCWEKTGYFLGQVCLDSLYLFASANPQFSP
jgi:hypothetical protein